MQHQHVPHISIWHIQSYSFCNGCLSIWKAARNQETQSLHSGEPIDLWNVWIILNPRVKNSERTSERLDKQEWYCKRHHIIFCLCHFLCPKLFKLILAATVKLFKDSEDFEGSKAQMVSKVQGISEFRPSARVCLKSIAIAVLTTWCNSTYKYEYVLCRGTKHALSTTRSFKCCGAVPPPHPCPSISCAASQLLGKYLHQVCWSLWKLQASYSIHTSTTQKLLLIKQSSHWRIRKPRTVPSEPGTQKIPAKANAGTRKLHGKIRGAALRFQANPGWTHLHRRPMIWNFIIMLDMFCICNHGHHQNKMICKEDNSTCICDSKLATACCSVPQALMAAKPVTCPRRVAQQTVLIFTAWPMI